MAWYPTNVGEGESERYLLTKERESEGMKVSKAIEYLSELGPDDQIIVNWFSRTNFEEYYNDEEPATDDQWLSLVNHLEKADQFWQSNHYAIEAEVDNWKDLQEEKNEESPDNVWAQFQKQEREGE
jgi:hypothetical protein